MSSTGWAASTPRVVAVIAAYNSERFIVETIESVLSELGDHDEVIVVDDGSTDRTADLVRRYPRVRLIQQENRGVSAARNTAIRASSAMYIAPIDHDDLWPSGRLDLMVSALEANDDAPYAVGRQVLMIEPGTPLPYWLRSTEPEELERFREERATGLLMMRRTAFDRVGPFDETMREGGEDVDWVFRCTELGLQEVVVDADVLLRRIYGGNMTADRVAMQRAMFAILRRRAQRRRAT